MAFRWYSRSGLDLSDGNRSPEPPCESIRVCLQRPRTGAFPFVDVTQDQLLIQAGRPRQFIETPPTFLPKSINVVTDRRLNNRRWRVPSLPCFSRSGLYAGGALKPCVSHLTALSRIGIHSDSKGPAGNYSSKECPVYSSQHHMAFLFTRLWYASSISALVTKVEARHWTIRQIGSAERLVVFRFWDIVPRRSICP